MANEIKIDPVLIIQLILQYGIPAALQIIDTVTKPSFTLDDLEKLRGLVRLPQDYLS